ncbi:RxLR effector candidate protein [Phytophthora cinnamomi]|nr:RxLR effector candidate protein [Phytophthora cinnamomi]
MFSICVSVRSGSYRVRQSEDTKASKAKVNKGVCLRKQHWLYTFYHVFEKFPVLGLLDDGATTPVDIPITCLIGEEAGTALEVCHDFFSFLMSDLMALNKELSGLDLTKNLSVRCASLCGVMAVQPMQTFVQMLITFLPVQICRAEANALTVLNDGVDQSPDSFEMELSTWEAADIAETIRFGLLSPVLRAWQGRCVVITSMGKQSTGKSYFLNHFTGSAFAIAGNRCTDGAWMTLRIMQNIMFVILDFEGLGSIERTNQEDVFLAILNASLSMFTIFRMEMRMDKEIDGLFTMFQKGIGLLKDNEHLFQGMLYMSVKDVNPDDGRGVVYEFQRKIQTLLEANPDQNFVTEMYSGEQADEGVAAIGAEDNSNQQRTKRAKKMVVLRFVRMMA